MAVSFLFAIHGAACGSFDARLPSIAAHAHAGPGGLDSWHLDHDADGGPDRAPDR
jgi:hypothetical protein